MNERGASHGELAPEREGQFRPKLSELPPFGEDRVAAYKPQTVDRARKGSALVRITHSVTYL